MDLEVYKLKVKALEMKKSRMKSLRSSIEDNFERIINSWSYKTKRPLAPSSHEGMYFFGNYNAQYKSDDMIKISKSELGSMILRAIWIAKDVICDNEGYEHLIWIEFSGHGYVKQDVLNVLSKLRQLLDELVEVQDFEEEEERLTNEILNM